MSARSGRGLAVRHSIAPRVLNGSLAQQSLVSTQHLSVRAVAPETNQSSIVTTFIWKDGGARVQLAGSFDDWRKHEMTYTPEGNTYVLVAEVPPGHYFYRFIVDGQWRVVDNDPNLREDQFGELSHFLEVTSESTAHAQPKDFSQAYGSPGVDEEDEYEPEPEGEDHYDEEGYEHEGEGEGEHEEDGEEGDTNPRESVPLPPRQRGEGFVDDYDNDEFGQLDLQADVFEAMKDITEKTTSPGEAGSPASAKMGPRSPRRPARRRKPARRVVARVFALLFGGEIEEEPPPEREAAPTRNQNKFAMAGRIKAGATRGLRVWFPSEQNFPKGEETGTKMAPAETADVVDVAQTAMKLHQAEENANNRQLLGKTLFAQGKYDAALALFSLSVKLRVDNGLKNTKNTAIAHTDCASAFIYLQDFKNAEKHLNISLNIFQKGTFSGGRAELGDVHCFLGVVADMRNDLRVAELSYRNAIDLYEKARATQDNPNYETTLNNLQENRKRQKQQEMARAANPEAFAEEEAAAQSAAPQSVEYAQSVTSQPRSTQAASRKPSASRSPRPAQTRSPKPPKGRSPRQPPGRRAPAPPAVAHAPPAQTGYADDEPEEQAPPPSAKRRSSRPQTWKDLAAHARASMPHAPPTEESVPEAAAPAGSYEEMSRGWHQDGRKLLAGGRFQEAIDMYTLAIYTRKRHGPWTTLANAGTHTEYARALFGTRDLPGAAAALKDAVLILENLEGGDAALARAEAWGSLGAVLDRLGGYGPEAEAAHCAGMAMFGKAGVDTEDKRWMKAWRNLCASIKAQGNGGPSTDEVWNAIDCQIRGTVPVYQASNIRLREAEGER